MKREIAFLLLGVLFLAGCTNLDTVKDNTSIAEQPIQSESNKTIDGFRFWKGQTAAKDDLGNIYCISKTAIFKISQNGTIEKILDGVIFGSRLALHGEYIYYLDCATLCRIKKTGEEKQEFSSDFKNKIGTIYIHESKLYITVSGNQLERYYADISDDPQTMNYVPGTNGFSPETFAENYYDFEILLTETFNCQVILVECPNEYLYFWTTEREFGRIELGSRRIEILPISPYQFEKVTIESGWIFYNDNKGSVWRTSEDLEKTEEVQS